MMFTLSSLIFSEHLSVKILSLHKIWEDWFPPVETFLTQIIMFTHASSLEMVVAYENVTPTRQEDTD